MTRERIPSDAPEELKRVAEAWAANAEEAARNIIEEYGQEGDEARETLEFWQDRVCVDKDEPWRAAPERWTLSDNCGQCSIVSYYPTEDRWCMMYPYSDEHPIAGGFTEALAGAQIVWTG